MDITHIDNGSGRDLLSFIFANNNETFTVHTLARKFSATKYPVSASTVRKYFSRFIAEPQIKKHLQVKHVRKGIKDVLHVTCVANSVSQDTLDCFYVDMANNRKRKKINEPVITFSEDYMDNTLFLGRKNEVFNVLINLPVGKEHNSSDIRSIVNTKYKHVVPLSLTNTTTCIARVVYDGRVQKYFTVKKEGTRYIITYKGGFISSETKTEAPVVLETKTEAPVVLEEKSTEVSENCEKASTLLYNSMNETAAMRNVEEPIESILDNLMDAVQSAGGRCADFTSDKLKNMSALDFITVCHFNMDIKFSKKEK